MLKKSSLCVLFVFLILLSSVFALTAKIGNPRVVLHTEVTPSKPALISRTLEVINDNNISVNIMMEISDNCTDIIKISSDNLEFSLQPDTSRKVPFTVKVTQPGFYECKINTYFKQGDDQGPGVALASVVIITAKGEGPEVKLPEDNSTVSPPVNNTKDEISGGVSVNPGGKPELPKKTDYNVFAIAFFILMLIIVVLLAVFVSKRRHKDESKV